MSAESLAQRVHERIRAEHARCDPADCAFLRFWVEDVATVLTTAEELQPRGMEVDGDMLRDAIAEAAPREWTDTAARELAERALDAVVLAGVTVLHGPDLTPRAAPAPISDPHGALIAELQGQVNARADAGERMATAFDALDRALARGAWIGSERTALRGAVAAWRAGR